MEQVVIVTIGEAPRQDIRDTYDAYFATSKTVSQCGLLDKLSYQEALAQLGAKHNEETLVSTFRNGQFIKMSHTKVERALQTKITQLEKQGVTLIVVLCTAEFQTLTTTTAHLIEPEKIILPIIKKRIGEKRLGVIVPLPEQVLETTEKWQGVGQVVSVATASPYAFDEISFTNALADLVKQQVAVIVLDCMGYNRKMRTFLEGQTELTIYQSNEILFEYIIEEITKRSELKC